MAPDATSSLYKPLLYNNNNNRKSYLCSFREAQLHVGTEDVLHVKVCKETSYISDDKIQDTETFPGTPPTDKNVQINYPV